MTMRKARFGRCCVRSDTDYWALSMTIRHGCRPRWTTFPRTVRLSEAVPADNLPECAPAGDNFGAITTRSPTGCGFESHRRHLLQALKNSDISAYPAKSA